MKKIFFALLSFCAITSQVVGQACTGGDVSGPSVCVPNGSVNGPGFQDPSSISCIVQGVEYNNSDQFNMYNSFDFQGLQEVDSIEFLSITGLPAGICWSTNKANNRFTANESGCLNFKGITSASAGQYKLILDLNAWINHSTIGPTRPGSYLIDLAGVKIWLRVQTPGGACIGVDTSVGTSISEINSDVTFMNVIPNPTNSNTQLSFVAEKSANYTFKLTDITGKILRKEEVIAMPGVNTRTIERDNLPAGLYFVSLTDGQSLITRRLSITEQ